MLPSKLLSFVVASIAFSSPLFAAIEVKQMPDKVRVEIDGKLFTEYCYTGASHVYFYPLIGPGGAKMTRAWPMENVAGEEHDHPHHRSLWYSHGAVNGFDFWTEAASHKEAPKNLGKIVHDKFLEVKGGEAEGVIRDQLRWEAPDGTVPLTSVQTLRVFRTGENERRFDFEVILTAGDKDAVFGDTKEGTMALRVAESMRLKAAKDQPPGQGHMVNSEGIRDGDAWGKRAAWVDYSGPVDGKLVGITVMDHPKNPRHPTRWHARDYGLFAANPFCEREMDKSQAEGAGDFKLAAGNSVTFRYRFILHQGGADPSKIAAAFTEYARTAQ